MKSRLTRSTKKQAAAKMKGLTSSGESNPVTAPISVRLNIHSILVPTDFSPESATALAYALSFARRFGAKLTLLHVVEPLGGQDLANAFLLMLENEKLMTNCKRQLKRILNNLEIEPKLIEKVLVRYGRAFHEIVKMARTLRPDLIIISTHGHAGVKHALLGGISERVARDAPGPVLVIQTAQTSNSADFNPHWRN